ncbi:hypothetical protein [Geitlerinema sp. PCC 9228]|jgi:hypothetical protein|uniref:hypothetical protein n=1 Tax=Geitlerinema sp. PCC 9228 TaxID=111611 RepID=UPI0008F991D1|nr:hypothetical protein [Geitlerinema sp. PCC 9228]
MKKILVPNNKQLHVLVDAQRQQQRFDDFFAVGRQRTHATVKTQGRSIARKSHWESMANKPR